MVIPLALLSALALGSLFHLPYARVMLFYLVWGFAGYELYTKECSLVCSKASTTFLANFFPLLGVVILVFNERFPELIWKMLSHDAWLFLYFMTLPMQYLRLYEYINEHVLWFANVALLMAVFYAGCAIRERKYSKKCG